MALLPVNLHPDGTLRGADSQGIVPQLEAALNALPDRQPIIVMVHGYRYSPFEPEADPHLSIFAARPARSLPRTTSWPRRLGMMQTGGPLGISFGWDGCGRIGQVHRRASDAGRALGHLINLISERAPARRVDILAHSLGAKVALASLDDAPRGSVRRVLLLAAACYRDDAQTALATPAGESAEFVSVRGRENAPFDTVAEMILPAPRPFDRMLGRGLCDAPARWLDLPLDRAEVLERLRQAGFRIAPPQPICHWSGFLRPGVFSFYRALLAADPLPLSQLASMIPPERAKRRPLLPVMPFPLAGRPS